MNKKKGIKIIIVSSLAILSIVIFSFAIVNGSFTKKTYATIWTSDYIESLETLQEKLIAHGIKASSSHNMQPWLVKVVSENQIELYVDMTKDLSVVDANHLQLLVSHGTFIENYSQIAASEGFEIELILNEPDFKAELPHVGTIKLIKSDSTVDTVSGSSFSPSDGSRDLAMLVTILDEIEESELNLDFEVIDRKLDVDELQTWIKAGVEIESTHKDAMEEMLSVFRWTETDKNEHNYGLTLNQFNSIEAMFIQPFMKYSNVTWESFGQQSIDEFDVRMENEFAYILVRSQNQSSIDYINVGRAYQRLVTSGTGFVIRPNIQLLETYGDLKDYGKAFKENYNNGNGQIVMILGIQLPSSKSLGVTPRHTVDEILLD